MEGLRPVLFLLRGERFGLAGFVLLDDPPCVGGFVEFAVPVVEECVEVAAFVGGFGERESVEVLEGLPLFFGGGFDGGAGDFPSAQFGFIPGCGGLSAQEFFGSELMGCFFHRIASRKAAKALRA